jgi:outer membrane protein assembly factor BamB
VTSVDTSSRAWTSPTLDGQIYGEPLVYGGAVYIATENDTVDALSASTGSLLWSTHLATPVPASTLSCGNITPTVGITGTPVIDPSRHEIFVVADELANGSPRHVLVGLNTGSGAIELSQAVDPAGDDPAALLQRTGLALDAGLVVFGLGGNYGDCGNYRGHVVAAGEIGGSPRSFTVDAGAGRSQGAIWMGGAAPVVDAKGNIWVSVGNGSVHSAAQPYDDSDSVLELSPTLQVLQYFAPSNWAQNNERDLDLSMAPALLQSGQVVVAGKSGVAYLLNEAALGGIGGQQAEPPAVCHGDIDGGSAVVGTTVYVPCLAGIVALAVNSSPPGLGVRWSTAAGGGPPIVAGGLVWTIAGDMLDALDPASGALVQQATLGPQANHFPTPSVGDGLLLAPVAEAVVAFRASEGSATTAPPATQPVPATSGPARTDTSGGNSDRALLGVAIGLGGAGLFVGGSWLRRRRRRVRPEIPHRLRRGRSGEGLVVRRTRS